MDTLESSLSVKKKITELNIHFPHDLAITLLSISPREMRHDYTKIHTQLFIAALFVMAGNGEQSKCLSIGEWLNKLWYLHFMEFIKYYAAINAMNYGYIDQR